MIPNNISVSAVGYDQGQQCAFIEFTELDNYIGATVSQAKIHMYAYRSMASGHLLIGPCNAAWDEATLTWNSIPGVYESQQIDYCSFYQWTVIDVTSYVEAILNGTRDNHGFCLFDNDGDDEGMDLHSGEYDDADYRPKLYLEYTPSALSPFSWGEIKALE